jgi:hypothetical protein
VLNTKGHGVEIDGIFSYICMVANVNPYLPFSLHHKRQEKYEELNI